MKYKAVGGSGLKVSELCLGAMTFGAEADEATSIRILDMFVDAGGDFIDTANIYSRGISETIIGKWLRTRQRDDLVLATKVFWPMGDKPNDRGGGRKSILTQVENSLRRLQTDYLDVYYIHFWPWDNAIEETLSTFNDLVRSGKVRYLGVSNFTAGQLQYALDLCVARGWEKFIVLQPRYNLLTRSTEWELLPLCLREGLGVVPWSPLHGGWLSGKYTPGMKAPTPSLRVAADEEKGGHFAWSRWNNEHTWKVIQALFEVARETGKTPSQVALNWVCSKRSVTAPIIGVRSIAHLEDNIQAVGWSLTADQMKKLDGASAVTLSYPYDLMEKFLKE